MHSGPILTLEQILPILPHRPPFLFVDAVLDVQPNSSIVAARTLRREEPYFDGHFPGRPILPGVLAGEAIAQACGLLLALSDRAAGLPAPATPRMYYLAETRLKFSHPCGPGDTLELRGHLEKSMGRLFMFRGEALVQARVIASGALTLAHMGEE